MANRLIRDWTTSENVDKISAEAERFFTRLIMKVDDYGYYDANPKLLKAALFPLKDVMCDQVVAWLEECCDAGLVTQYTVDGKEYLQIIKFGQRLRTMSSKFPHPADNPRTIVSGPRTIDGDLRTIVSSPPPEGKRTRRELELEVELETEVEVTDPVFDRFWTLYNKKVGRSKTEKKFKSLPKAEKEAILLALPAYVKSTPDVKFRKDPLTYLNNRSWEDEIIQPRNTQEPQKSTTSFSKSQDEYFS